jgi:formylglycine-generating enzyme required for sulfatase activity
VINVSWDDAQKYVSWLSQKTGAEYRLLSEAEWEYAARAGTTTAFSTGKTITTDQANFDGSYTYNGSRKGKNRGKTVEVGSFAPNEFGLYDMHGNVSEWTEDCYHDSYQGAPSDAVALTTGSCNYRVDRGGSWINVPRYLRSAIRGRSSSGFRDNYLGFRLARALR